MKLVSLSLTSRVPKLYYEAQYDDQTGTVEDSVDAMWLAIRDENTTFATMRRHQDCAAMKGKDLMYVYIPCFHYLDTTKQERSSN